MKNTLLILNIILLAATAFLFYKIYNDEPAVMPSPVSKSKANIVYINSDSLLENYPLVKSLEKEFGQKRDSVDRILQLRDKSLKQEYAQFEQRASSLSQEQQQSEYENFMGKQQALEKLRDDLLKDLSDTQAHIQDSIHENLLVYLKKYNTAYGYDFIMSYQRGSGILYANDSLDITNEIIKGLKKSSE